MTTDYIYRLSRSQPRPYRPAAVHDGAVASGVAVSAAMSMASLRWLQHQKPVAIYAGP